MATPINSPLTGEIWHLSIDDLLEPVSQAPRLGGPGPFVINLSASTAPISQPGKGIVDTQAHVYQLQRLEDRRMRYRLRLGPFASEDEADAVLKKVRDTYPSALTATAEPDDLRSIAALQAKADAQQKAALRAAEQAATAKARWAPKPIAKPPMIPVLTEMATVAPERPARTPAAVPTPGPAFASAPAAVPTPAPAPAFASAPAAVPTPAPAPAFASAPAAVPTPAPAPAFASVPAAAPTSAPARLAAVAQRRELPRRGAAAKALATSLRKFVAPAPNLPGIARKPAAAAAAAPLVAAPPVAAQPAVVPSAARHIEQLSTLLASLETTQTVRPLTPLELENHDAARWFVIQLALADQAFDPNTVPNLDIFSEYRLYSVAGIDQGRLMHALRLGFFTEEISAGAVAGYLAVYFDKPTVKRVSAAERGRFVDERLEARKDIGATGRHAVIEITSERVVRENRNAVAMHETSNQPVEPRTVTRKRK